MDINLLISENFLQLNQGKTETLNTGTKTQRAKLNLIIY